MSNSSKVIKSSGFSWEGVPHKTYKDDSGTFDKVHRYSLLGQEPEEQDLNFHTRYFEIESGGYSTLEYHRHPHAVVVIRGSGSVVLGNSVHELAPHDVVHITPQTLHQFHADKGETLGFLCTVDRYRDRPIIPDETYIKDYITADNVRQKIRR